MRTHRMETLACKWDGRRNLRCSPVGTLSHWSALSEVAELEGVFWRLAASFIPARSLSRAVVTS